MSAPLVAAALTAWREREPLDPSLQVERRPLGVHCDGTRGEVEYLARETLVGRDAAAAAGALATRYNGCGDIAHGIFPPELKSSLTEVQEDGTPIAQLLWAGWIDLDAGAR